MKFSILNTLQRQMAAGQGKILWDGLDQHGRDAMIELMIRQSPKRTMVILCDNDRRVNSLVVSLSQVVDVPVLALYQRSHLPVEVLAKEEDDGDRVAALYRLATGQPCVLVAGATVLFDAFPTPAYFKAGILTLGLGQELEQEAFLSRLLTLGYVSASVCDQPGTFARRGGIVDFFSPQYEQPLRVEWFDDEIDSLRFYSAETQKSEQNVEEVTGHLLHRACGRGFACPYSTGTGDCAGAFRGGRRCAAARAFAGPCK